MRSPKVEVQVKRLNHGAGLAMPDYATAGAAGMDICAAESLTLRVGKRHAVATGFAFAIPEGYEVQVRPRRALPSNMALPVSIPLVPSTAITAAK